jgi:uncharacterized membrane protein YgdD (TMEM256/DUF423 family)
VAERLLHTRQGSVVAPSAQLRRFLVMGAVNGALAVLLGAFAAHVLRQRLDPAMLEVFRTGVQYHGMHSLALLAVGLLGRERAAGPALVLAGWALMVGLALFSGSLYLLALSGVHWLGAVTPFGGIAFLIGWIAMAVAAARA